MHAYMIVGKEKKSIQDEVDKLSKKLKVKTIPHELSKISHVRELEKITRLKVHEPTAFVIRDIDQSTVECQNAFLKSLEEPQARLHFILTAGSIHNLLPTILSRCQVINAASNFQSSVDNKSEEFLSLSTGEKLNFTALIKQREEAVNFVQYLIILLRNKLFGSEKDMELIAYKLKFANDTLNNLKASGNVQLQLANLVIQMANN